MVRVIFIISLFILVFALVRLLFYVLIKKYQIIKNIESSNIIQTNGHLELKNSEEDYWYKFPHYKVLPSGKKINLSEYLTYKEYSHMDNVKLLHFLHDLDSRLSNSESSNKSEITLD